VNAGFSNTTGNSNSFVGRDAGYSNMTGANNSFVGESAGQANTTGNANSFFGKDAGFNNTTGFNNSFFGMSAGLNNTTGLSNSFFGRDAGQINTTGGGNSFFGTGTGLSNMTGGGNSFFGRSAGQANTFGNFNSFFGFSAGESNTTGSNNTVIGQGADVGANNLTFATAIGSGAVVTASNRVQIGRAADTVNVPGTLTKAAGSFKIDHPLDPQNKTLSHSFVESPDMMNVYNGNITTDKNGEAIVTLPDYFEALNRDFRYQLTVIGTFAQAIISEEITGNRFKIRTDKPNVKVSWQVTGIRQDRFAEEHRIPTTEDKPAHEKGKCLYAPLCGDASINVAPRQAKP